MMRENIIYAYQIEEASPFLFLWLFIHFFTTTPLLPTSTWLEMDCSPTSRLAREKKQRHPQVSEHQNLLRNEIHKGKRKTK